MKLTKLHISSLFPELQVRCLRVNEIKLLQDFLYEAIFIPEGVEPPGREIIELPELKIYYSKRKVISKRLLLYSKQIMRFGCMRR